MYRRRNREKLGYSHEPDRDDTGKAKDLQVEHGLTLEERTGISKSVLGNYETEDYNYGPSCHINYEKWNTLVIGPDMLTDKLKWQIGNSYDLIKPKARRRRND
jgi:hypothetical protein